MPVRSQSVGTKTRFLVEKPFNVAGQTFRCHSLPMGVDNEVQLAAHKAGCATLTKTP